MVYPVRTKEYSALKIYVAKFYSYFYPFVFGGGQASMLVTAQLAYHYDWKYMYYFMMLMIIIGHTSGNHLLPP